MAKRFELVVFDWDGTLMDSAGAIVNAIQAACVDLDVTPPDDARARHVIGLGLSDALQQAVPDLSPMHYEKMVERYRHHYLSQDQDLLLFDGAFELIQSLRASGFLLGVATGKSRRGLERALDVSGLREFFHATRCADECHSKPHPQMLYELMEEFALDAERLLMIGDTSHDLLMAKNAGVAALAVSYGAHDRVALEAEVSLACVDSVHEMRDWLLKYA